jgi:hypothetical protein
VASVRAVAPRGVEAVDGDAGEEEWIIVQIVLAVDLDLPS